MEIGIEEQDISVSLHILKLEKNIKKIKSFILLFLGEYHYHCIFLFIDTHSYIFFKNYHLFIIKRKTINPIFKPPYKILRTLMH